MFLVHIRRNEDVQGRLNLCIMYDIYCCKELLFKQVHIHTEVDVNIFYRFCAFSQLVLFLATQCKLCKDFKRRCANFIRPKTYALCEDRTHDLQIMRLTRCLLRCLLR